MPFSQENGFISEKPVNYCKNGVKKINLENLYTIPDFQFAFPKAVDEVTEVYYNSGADEGGTVQINRDGFKRIGLRPRVFQNVEGCQTSTNIFGKEVGVPVGISPTAMNAMAHPDGELGTAEGAACFNTIFILSLNATTSMEEIAEVAPGLRKWLQIPLVSRDIAKYMIKKAEECGFEGIVLSVDTVTLGKRPELLRNNFTLPQNLKMPILEAYAESVGKNVDNPEYLKYSEKWFQKSYSWEHVHFLKSVTSLPIILKGIQTGEDALLAVNNGADAIFLSNHGGRQLDTGIATIDILPEIVAAVKGQLPIFLDGGVMSGSDVFKALALGADMVFLGRPVLWGLAVGGVEGVKRVLQIYRDELITTMQLTGVKSIKEIVPSHVVGIRGYPL